MADDHTDDSAHVTPPTARELRAARRRAHEVEKQRRAKQGGGKGDKKGKGGQPRSDDQRHRR
jgi:hypothetical protein